MIYHDEISNAYTRQAHRPNQYTELFLPTPNEFIPKNFSVDKKPVKKVIWPHAFMGIVTQMLLARRQAHHPTHVPHIHLMAQEGRPVLATERGDPSRNTQV
jgi:secreted Zn-dependent insulinase-like peptidase